MQELLWDVLQVGDLLSYMMKINESEEFDVCKEPDEENIRRLAEFFYILIEIKVGMAKSEHLECA